MAVAREAALVAGGSVVVNMAGVAWEAEEKVLAQTEVEGMVEKAMAVAVLVVDVMVAGEMVREGKVAAAMAEEEMDMAEMARVKTAGAVVAGSGVEVVRVEVTLAAAALVAAAEVAMAVVMGCLVCGAAEVGRVTGEAEMVGVAHGMLGRGDPIRRSVARSTAVAEMAVLAGLAVWEACAEAATAGVKTVVVIWEGFPAAERAEVMA